MKNVRRIVALVLTMVMVFALAACGGNAETAEPTAAPAATDAPAVAENAVFRKLYASEVTTLNYLITTQENEMTIAANVVDCLVEYDNFGNITYYGTLDKEGIALIFANTLSVISDILYCNCYNLIFCHSFSPYYMTIPFPQERLLIISSFNFRPSFSR